MRRYIYLLITFFLFSGCAIHHEAEKRIYQKVLVEETPQLKTAGKVDPLQAARKKTEEIRVKDHWTLEDCYVLALLENRALMIAGEDYFQATLFHSGAWGLLMPKIGLNGSERRREKTLSTGNAAFTQNKQDEAAFHIDQPVFQGFKEMATFSYARAKEEAEHFKFLDARTRLLLTVSDAFYGVLKLKKSVRILKTTVRLHEERLKEMQGRFEVGLARKTELLLIKSEWANARSRLTQDRLSLKTAKKKLSLLLWSPVLKPLKEDIAIPVLSPLQQWVAQAGMNRDDLKSAAASVLAAQGQVKLAAADYWPLVSLSGDYFLQRAGVLENVTWEILASAFVPIFNRGLTRMKHREAASQWRQAVARFEDLQHQVEVEVTEAYHECRAIQSRVHSLKEETLTTGENFRLLQEEYRQGITTNLEVMTVFNQYRESLLQWKIEQFNLKIAYIKLQVSVGSVLY